MRHKKIIHSIVCDLCGKETEPITSDFEDTPTVKIKEKGDPDYGWLWLDLDGHSNFGGNYKDFCSTDCVKKYLDERA